MLSVAKPAAAGFISLKNKRKAAPSHRFLESDARRVFPGGALLPILSGRHGDRRGICFCS
jgi:hypothetical protein